MNLRITKYTVCACGHFAHEHFSLNDHTFSASWCRTCICRKFRRLDINEP